MPPVSPIKFVNKIASCKLFNKYLYIPAKENPARFAGRMALVSALTKDTVNCYYYYTQSKNNERIPEDKRGFVASLDLMNGFINIVAQLTVGAWLDKHGAEWFDKFIDKKLNVNSTIKIAQKLTNKIKKKHPNISFKDVENTLRKEEMLSKAGKTAKWLKIGYSAVIMLIATQVIVKRIFTPLIATPLAEWYNKNILEKKKKHTVKKA